MARKPNKTIEELAQLAYDHYKTHHDWPKVAQFRATHNCGSTRAADAIEHARKTQAASITNIEFLALARMANFDSIEEAREAIKKCASITAPTRATKDELRVLAALYAPQLSVKGLTREQLVEALRGRVTARHLAKILAQGGARQPWESHKQADYRSEAALGWEGGSQTRIN